MCDYYLWDSVVAKQSVRLFCLSHPDWERANHKNKKINQPAYQIISQAQLYFPLMDYRPEKRTQKKQTRQLGQVLLSLVANELRQVRGRVHVIR